MFELCQQFFSQALTVIKCWTYLNIWLLKDSYFMTPFLSDCTVIPFPSLLCARFTFTVTSCPRDFFLWILNSFYHLNMTGILHPTLVLSKLFRDTNRFCYHQMIEKLMFNKSHVWDFIPLSKRMKLWDWYSLFHNPYYKCFLAFLHRFPRRGLRWKALVNNQSQPFHQRNSSCVV